MQSVKPENSEKRRARKEGSEVENPEQAKGP